VFDNFDADYKPTLGVDIYTYETEPGAQPGADAKFVIWDTDGNFGDSIFSLVYIRRAAAALIVGDLTRHTTLESMVEIGRNFMQAMPGRYCCFVMNKSDLACEAVRLPAQLAQLAVPTIRTSAKTGENIRHAFLEAADAIRRRGF
jgi:GTPase SAR1 family protein